MAMICIAIFLCFAFRVYWNSPVKGSVTPSNAGIRAWLFAPGDTLNAPVLCEQSQTMFYAGPDPAVTTWAWWENTPEKFTGDVLSGKFQYVAVEYTPPVGVVTALQQAGYRQIAPGAWEKR